MAFIRQSLKMAGLRAPTLGDLTTTTGMVRSEPTPHAWRISLIKRELAKELKISEERRMRRDVSIRVLQPSVSYRRLLRDWAKGGIMKMTPHYGTACVVVTVGTLYNFAYHPFHKFAYTPLRDILKLMENKEVVKREVLVEDDLDVIADHVAP